MRSFALLACLAVGAVPSMAIVYDYATDFSITNGNPNGVWSYGAKRKDQDGKPTGEFKVFDSTESSWYLHWYMAANENNTFGGQTWKNVSGGTQYGIPDGKVSLNGDAYSTSTARWTAPSDGTIDLTISLGSSNSARMLTIKGIVVNDGAWWGYSDTGIPVVAGDVIDLTMYAAPHSGNTRTDITIDFTPVPEPASLAVLAIGSLALLKRRKK